MSVPAVLIVDDEPKICHALRRAMHREPYEVLYAAGADEALKLMAEREIDVVIADENMPGLKGSMLLARIRAQWPDVVRMMLTGDARLETVVSAVNRGEIFRFFIKPANEAEIIVSVRDALKMRALKRDAGQLHEMPRKPGGDALRPVGSPMANGNGNSNSASAIKLVNDRNGADRLTETGHSDVDDVPEVISLDSNMSDDVDGLLDEIKTELDKLDQ